MRRKNHCGPPSAPYPASSPAAQRLPNSARIEVAVGETMRISLCATLAPNRRLPSVLWALLNAGSRRSRPRWSWCRGPLPSCFVVSLCLLPCSHPAFCWAEPIESGIPLVWEKKPLGFRKEQARWAHVFSLWRLYPLRRHQRRSDSFRCNRSQQTSRRSFRVRQRLPFRGCCNSRGRRPNVPEF